MATLQQSASAKRWLPLEANPDVMNQVFSVDPPPLCLYVPNAIMIVTNFN